MRPSASQCALPAHMLRGCEPPPGLEKNEGSACAGALHEDLDMYTLRCTILTSAFCSLLQEHYLWMVLPYVPGGSVESAMNYAFPKVILISSMTHFPTVPR